MGLIEAVLLVSGFGLIWLVINLILAYRQKKNKIVPYIPVEYYKNDKGWWKNW